MNTDGVNLYSSSRIELWPIFLAINELSPGLRFSRENLLIAGIWQGKGKPPFEQYMLRFSEEINRITDEGVYVKAINKHVYLSVICNTMDLLAKAGVLNMTQFNGENACITCEEPGIVVSKGKGHVRSYPFRSSDEKFKFRTNSEVKNAMSRATNNNRVKGFKGVSGLASMNCLDLVWGTVPDYMHCVLLGITKNLMHCWFSPSQSGKDYFIGKHLKSISARLNNIKPCNDIERLPRDLEKHYNHFRATELQVWLLYYGVPCVMDILPDKYLEHFCLLSEAIFILLGDAISPSGIARAHYLLTLFYSTYQDLYGQGSCGLNVHNTGSHLVDYVRMWGPIWAWSCFPFEDSNADILQSVHGTGLVTNQVLKYKSAQSMLRKTIKNDANIKNWKIKMRIADCAVCGGINSVPITRLEETIQQKLRQNDDVLNVLKANRLIKDGVRLYSEEYARTERRICYVILTKCDQICRVKYFLVLPEGNKLYAVVSYIKRINHPKLRELTGGKQFHFVQDSNEELDLITTDSILETLMFIKTSPTNYGFVSTIPNKHGRVIFK